MITVYSNTISVTTNIYPFEFTIKTDNAGVSTSTQFQLPLVSSLPLNAVVDWGDGNTDTITTFNQAETLHTYASAGTYTISITGDLSGWQFNNTGDRLKMLNILSWGVLNISVDRGFFGCTNLTCSATDAPTISSTSLNRFFVSCSNFNGAIGNWNTSSVTNMNSVFRFAISFNQNISLWNVSNVNDMREMFRNANAFNQDIGSWNVANVTNFADFMLGKTNLNYSAANLDSIYNNWSQLSVQPNLTISFGTIDYTEAGQEGKDKLINDYGWTITDGSQSPELLLDEYSGAAAAYSLRLLRSDYIGDAIRVRRASDNTELNIGFVNNVLDTASLTTFCSGTNGFVTTWYDQSGNANNATQATAANQPQIYDSLNGVILENAKPSLDNLNSGSGKTLGSAFAGFNTNDFSIFYVQKIQSSTLTTSSLYMGGTNDLAFFPYVFSGGTGARIFWRNVGSLTETNSGNISNLQVLYNIIYNTTNANWKVFRNTNQVVSQNVSVNLVPNTNFTIGGSGGAATYGGKYQELIIYPSDKSTDITGISNNINNFYSIY